LGLAVSENGEICEGQFENGAAIEPKLIISNDQPEIHLKTIMGQKFKICYKNGKFGFAISFYDNSNTYKTYNTKEELRKIFNFEKYILNKASLGGTDSKEPTSISDLSLKYNT